MPVVSSCSTCRRPLEPPIFVEGDAFCSIECLELAAEGYWLETHADRKTTVHHGPVAFTAKAPDKPKVGERMRDFLLRYLARTSR